MTVNTALVADLNALQTELNKVFPEREDAIEALLLAVLAKEHAFIVGPPGTGKSLLVTTLIKAITGATYFKCAMSKTRSAEAVLGPLDIKLFREQGLQVRNDKGYLTDVHFAFVDEIGKMSPILGHDLLAAYNEREKHEVNNGNSVHSIPLYTAFSASNEMLTDESDDAAALWDRILFRLVVDYLKDKKNFAALMQATSMAVATTIDWPTLQAAIDNDIPAVTIDATAMKGILKLRADLQKDHIRPSDRRWKASLKALQARAYLSGRDVIYEEDLTCLRFTLWDTLPQIEKVERLTAACANPFVDRVLNARSQVQEIAQGIVDRKDKAIPEKAAYAKEANGKLAQVRTELDKLLDDAKGRNIPKFKEVSDLHRDTLKNMYVVCFEQDEATAESVIASKLGKGDGGQV